MDLLEKLQEIEQKLFTLEQQFKSTVQTLPEPIFIIDEFGKYLDVINGQQDPFFPDKERFVGKYVHDLLPEQLADNFMQAISEAISTSSLQVIEYQFKPGDIAGSPAEGSRRRQWYSGRIYPIRDRSDEIHSVIFLAINISDRKNLEQQVRELAERDLLTGVFNRRRFMQIFDKEFSIARRYMNRLSILLIDIDNYKEISESFGLDGANTTLQRFAAFCEAILRKSDLFARYDGENFIVMLPNTPSLGAAIIADRLRANAEELRIPFENKSIRITVSIGVSLVLDKDKNGSAVLARADSALYQAKKQGGNTVEFS
jgi:diguanylate cyclase (GGDEF)-like protein/PAS domain S-box-containing protein